MTLEQIADHLQDAHKALKAAGEAAANGQAGGNYELFTESGDEIPDLGTLAIKVRQIAQDSK